VVVILRASPAVVAAHLPAAAARDALVRGHALLLAAFTRRGRVARFLRHDRLAWLAGGEEVPGDDDAPARRCEHAADRFTVALTVHRDDDVELHLAAEACAQPEGSVFTCTRDAVAFLDRYAATRAERRRAWEPLAPTAVEWRVPGLPSETRDALAFDSAFRQVPVRLLHAPRGRFQRVLQAESARPLPAP
jgi:hypothetical protein